jgi:ParB-like chromosome segregation protein Spo0J
VTASGWRDIQREDFGVAERSERERRQEARDYQSE